MAQKQWKYSDFKAGQEFTANHPSYGVVRGKVQIENNRIFFCQDVANGSEPRDKLGYRFGYVINKDNEKDPCIMHNWLDLVLLSPDRVVNEYQIY